MNLLSLEIPDDPVQLPDWLEAQLVGLHLGELVAELTAIHGQGMGGSLQAVCGNQLDEVLQNGLARFSHATLQELLRQPQLLLDLQERIFIEGGEYWRTVPRTQEHQARVAAVWERLKQEPRDRSRGQYRPRFLAALALATALTLLFGWWVQTPRDPVWGWNRPGVFAVAMAQDEYLNHLADRANEWFQQPRETRAQLQQRLREFRQACDDLIAAPHPQLEPELRDVLRTRCRNWAQKFDDQRVALENGAEVAEVRQAADETVTKLIGALRQQFPDRG